MNDKPLKDAHWDMFGRWVLKTRDSKNLTQQEAADLAAVDRQTWYRIEKGNSTKRESVIKIAEALDADIDYALELAGFASLAAVKARINEESKTSEPVTDAAVLRLSRERFSRMIEDYAALPEDERQDLETLIQLLEYEMQRRRESLP